MDPYYAQWYEQLPTDRERRIFRLWVWISGKARKARYDIGTEAYGIATGREGVWKECAECWHCMEKHYIGGRVTHKVPAVRGAMGFRYEQANQEGPAEHRCMTVYRYGEKERGSMVS